MPSPVLLSDAQVQQFICDGYLVLQPSVNPNIHKVIDEKFSWLAEHEKNPGNNITARLPELNAIIESPEVRGAMISLLGEDYITIPHRFWHFREAGKHGIFGGDDEEEFRKKSAKQIIGERSHQDGYCPSSTGKSHALQYLRFMYYSHDMTLENGPTHIAPATQYNATVSDEDRERQIPVIGKAGTVFISHFDLVHAGSPNKSDRVRNMIKFLFTRKQNMQSPSWDHTSAKWKTPEQHSSPYQIENIWEQQWNWLCNQASNSSKNSLNENFEEPKPNLSTKEMVSFIQNIGKQPKAINFLMSQLNTTHQAVRSSAIYALGTIGKDAVEPLVRAIKQSEAPGDTYERLAGNCITISDESHALNACGEHALDSISQLLEEKNAWIQINALHLISDSGQSNDKIEAAVLQCLKSEFDIVVSFAAITIGRIGNKKSIPYLLDLFNTKYSPENFDLMVNKLSPNAWPNEWVIHFNAALSLLRLADQADEYEANISELLEHPFGQVSILIAECLKVIGTTSALRRLVDFYHIRRWDDSICAQKSF